MTVHISPSIVGDFMSAFPDEIIVRIVHDGGAVERRATIAIRAANWLAYRPLDPLRLEWDQRPLAYEWLTLDGTLLQHTEFEPAWPRVAPGFFYDVDLGDLSLGFSAESGPPS